MPDKIYRFELTDDAVQPITIPNGATLLKATRWPDKNIELYFLGNNSLGLMDFVIEQVHNDSDVLEESIRHITSVEGIYNSRFTVTHLFEVHP